METVDVEGNLSLRNPLLPDDIYLMRNPVCLFIYLSQCLYAGETPPGHKGGPGLPALCAHCLTLCCPHDAAHLVLLHTSGSNQISLFDEKQKPVLSTFCIFFLSFFLCFGLAEDEIQLG